MSYVQLEGGRRPFILRPRQETIISQSIPETAHPPLAPNANEKALPASDQAASQLYLLETSLKHSPNSAVIRSMLDQFKGPDSVERVLSELVLYRFTPSTLLQDVMGTRLPAEIKPPQAKFIRELTAQLAASLDLLTDPISRTMRDKDLPMLTRAMESAYKHPPQQVEVDVPVAPSVIPGENISPETVEPGKIPGENVPATSLPSQYQKETVTIPEYSIFGPTETLSTHDLDSLTTTLHEAAVYIADSGILPPHLNQELERNKGNLYKHPADLASLLRRAFFFYEQLNQPQTSISRLNLSARALTFSVSGHIYALPEEDKTRQQCLAALEFILDTLGSITPPMPDISITQDPDWIQKLHSPIGASENETQLMMQQKNVIAQLAFPASTQTRTFVEHGQPFSQDVSHNYLIFQTHPLELLLQGLNRIQRHVLSEFLLTGRTGIPRGNLAEAKRSIYRFINLPIPPELVSTADQNIPTDAGPGPDITRSNKVIEELTARIAADGLLTPFSDTQSPTNAAIATLIVEPLQRQIDQVATDFQKIATARSTGEVTIADTNEALAFARRVSPPNNLAYSSNETLPIPSSIKIVEGYERDYPTVGHGTLEKMAGAIINIFDLHRQFHNHPVIANTNEMHQTQRGHVLVTGAPGSGKDAIIYDMVVEGVKHLQPLGVKPLVSKREGAAMTTDTFVGEHFHGALRDPILELVRDRGISYQEAADIVNQQPLIIIVKECRDVLKSDIVNSGSQEASSGKGVQNLFRAISDPSPTESIEFQLKVAENTFVPIKWDLGQTVVFWVSSMSEDQTALNQVYTKLGVPKPIGGYYGIEDDRIFGSLFQLAKDYRRRIRKYIVMDTPTEDLVRLGMTLDCRVNPLPKLRKSLISTASSEYGLTIRNLRIDDEAIRLIAERSAFLLPGQGYSAVDQVFDQIVDPIRFKRIPLPYDASTGDLVIDKRFLQRVFRF